jgi:hypothetical protein
MEENEVSWLDGDWQAPVRIGIATEEKFWEKFERKENNAKGVYRLIALKDIVDFAPERLCRVCGIDGSGTLYIGAADSSLFNRVSSLVMTHRSDYKSTPHRPLSPRLAERFGEMMLAISWEYTHAPFEREQQLLVNYEALFGELPPANSQRSVFER